MKTLIITSLILLLFGYSDSKFIPNKSKSEPLSEKEESTNESYDCSWDNCNYGGMMNLNRVQLQTGKVVYPYTLKSDNVLTVTKALIADNAESPSYEWLGHSHEAILSIRIYYSNDSRNWHYFHSVPLPGMHFMGYQKKGTYKGYPKMEWLDCECMRYENLGILDWDTFPYKYIRFQIREGDKFQDDDILLDIYSLSSDFKYAVNPEMIFGDNYHHAAIWVKTVKYNR